MSIYDTKLYVCTDEQEGSCVGDLATILDWQLEHNIPALQCTYYEIGKEVSFEDIIEEAE